jgi:ABC-type transport system substrate-binding protein
VQPRWLAFLNGDLDLMYGVPNDFAYIAFPNNKLAPNLQKQGITMEQVAALDLTFAYFNMEDPTVGGYTPEKVALRRAISLAYNTRDEIAIVRKGQAVPAQAPWSPGVAGYDPNFRSDRERMERPEGQGPPRHVRLRRPRRRRLPRDARRAPLTLVFNSTPTAKDQQIDELWKRSMDDIGVRFTVRKAKWPDLLKESYAGKLMMWQLGGAASAPDADTWLSTLWGPERGDEGQRGELQAAGLRPDLREGAHDARLARAHQDVRGPREDRHFLRAVEDQREPHPHGHVASATRGIPSPLVQGNTFYRYLDIDTAKLAKR